MEEGTITRWLKATGEWVEKKETLFEVETDKMTIEVEALDSGFLDEVLVSEGNAASVGQTIAYLGDRV